MNSSALSIVTFTIAEIDGLRAAVGIRSTFVSRVQELLFFLNIFFPKK